MVFEEIYQQYYPKVFRLCMGYVNDEDKAKDLVQETFIKVWEHLAAFRKESNIGTWIFRITSNNCLLSIRKEKKYTRVEIPERIDEKDNDNNEDKIKLMYKFISELEEADSIICSLVLEGLPQAEIASIVGISEVNTRVKIHRIKEKLAKKFKLYE